MSRSAGERYVAALKEGRGLHDEFIYSMSFEDYRLFPDPFPRTTFSVREVQTWIDRYPNPARPGELFRWDIHGRLLEPARASIDGLAVVMIHGGAANEYEFLFTPDGPEAYLDLTKVDPAASRAGIAQHMASLGIPVLAVSLPGHYSRRPWPAIPDRRPEFVIGERPGDEELRNRLSVYTFRMCIEAVKALIEQVLPGLKLFIWGHSTGGEYFYLMEQYGLRNPLVGGLGFGTGMPAWLRKQWDLAWAEKSPEERAAPFREIAGLSRRSPAGYVKSGYVGPNQPWGTAERWFELENHRRPQFKPYLQDIEHSAHDVLLPEVRRISALPDDELFVTFKADLARLRGKKMLHIVGERDKGHWVEGGEKGLEFRREVYAFKRFAPYAEALRLVVVPRLTHYGHVESYNERLASLMVTAFKEYFPLL
ncbi:MAG TPA: alpha/beta fold hydrolase [candidate division Zixibacteria bacterium]|nr:alpha/beta fold hydrolase [candidate division Zixibacteria bacterium]